MSTPVTNRLLTTEEDARQAEGVLQQIVGPQGVLSAGHHNREMTPLPREIGVLLQQVLQAVARGLTVTVTAIPAEVTTVTAAAMVGVSRPTLMRMIRDGELPAHKVGTHTRLASADVTAFIEARRARQRAAFDELRSILDD